MKSVENLKRNTHSLLLRPLEKQDQDWWQEDEPIARVIQEQKDLRVKDKEYHLCIFHGDNKKIGSLAFKGIIRENLRTAYLELAFDKKEVGDFILLELMSASCDLGFNEIDLNRLEILTLARQIQLKNILQRAGFRNEGLRKYAVFSDKQWHDANVFAITKKEYTEKNLHQLMQSSVNLR